jgi:signal transduction histidine kinase
MSEMSGLQNFFFGRTKDNKYVTDMMDMKLFYVFENSKNPGLKTKKQNSKKRTISQSSSRGSTEINMKVEYSLREISELPVQILCSKIFTFDSKLAQDDLT